MGLIPVLCGRSSEKECPTDPQGFQSSVIMVLPFMLFHPCCGVSFLEPWTWHRFQKWGYFWKVEIYGCWLLSFLAFPQMLIVLDNSIHWRGFVQPGQKVINTGILLQISGIFYYFKFPVYSAILSTIQKKFFEKKLLKKFMLNYKQN